MGRVSVAQEQGFIRRLREEDLKQAQTRRQGAELYRDKLLSALGDEFLDYAHLFLSDSIAMVGRREAIGRSPYGVPLLTLEYVDGVPLWQLVFSLRPKFVLATFPASDISSASAAAREFASVESLLAVGHLLHGNMGFPNSPGRLTLESAGRIPFEQLQTSSTKTFRVGEFDADLSRIRCLDDVLVIQLKRHQVDRETKAQKRALRALGLYLSPTQIAGEYLVSIEPLSARRIKNFFVWRQKSGWPQKIDGASAKTDALLLGVLNPSPYLRDTTSLG